MMKSYLVLIIGLLVILAACTQTTQPQKQVQESNFNELSQKQAAKEQDVGEIEIEELQTQEVDINSLFGYRDYNKEEFEVALKSDKVVFLEFHAVWCPICNALEPKIYAAFEELPKDKVVGFKADFDTEVELKKKYNVISQHTHIIIKNGEVKLKSLETWEKEDVINAIMGVVNG